RFRRRTRHLGLLRLGSRRSDPPTDRTRTRRDVRASLGISNLSEGQPRTELRTVGYRTSRSTPSEGIRWPRPIRQAQRGPLGFPPKRPLDRATEPRTTSWGGPRRALALESSRC